jgi:hypothetical protein
MLRLCFFGLSLAQIGLRGSHVCVHNSDYLIVIYCDCVRTHCKPGLPLRHWPSCFHPGAQPMVGFQHWNLQPEGHTNVALWSIQYHCETHQPE